MTAWTSSIEERQLEEVIVQPEVDSDPAAMRQRHIMPLQEDHDESGSMSHKTVNNVDQWSAHSASDRSEKSWDLSSLSSQQDFDEDVESVTSLQGGQLGRYRMDSSQPIIQHLNPLQPDSNVASDKSIRKRRQNEAVAAKSEKKAPTSEPKDRKSSNFKFKFKRKISKKKKKINDDVETNSNVSAASSDNDIKLPANKSPKRNKSKRQSIIEKAEKAESNKSIKDNRTSFNLGSSDNIQTTSRWFKRWRTKSKRKHKSPSTSPRRSAMKKNIAEADQLEYRRFNGDRETSTDKVDNVTRQLLHRRRQRDAEHDDNHFRQEDLPAASVASAESQERGVILSAPPSPILRISGRSVEFADDKNQKHTSKSERRSSTSGKSLSGSSGSQQTSEDNQSSQTTDSESNSGSTSGKTSLDERDYYRRKYSKTDRAADAEKLKQSRRKRRSSRHAGSGTWRRHQSRRDESDTESSMSGAGSSSTASAVSQIVIEENDEHSTYKPLFGGIQADTASIRVGQSGADDDGLPPSKIFYV